MAIPDYQAFLLPLLQLLEDGQVYSVRTTYGLLADRLQLSDADRQHLLPSGQQRTYENRIGWATLHLKKAGLIDKPKRGQAVITDRGRDYLTTSPEKITAKSLQIFPEYQEFCQGKAKPDLVTPMPIELESDRTPEEVLQDVTTQA